MFLRSPLAPVAWLVVAVLALGACTTTESTPTTLSVVFGEGAIPSVFPEALPVPEEAVIGATMVDSPRSVVELVFTIPAPVTSTVAYFETNLPARGFTISASSGDAAQWHVEFSGDGVSSGAIDLGSGGPGITLGTIQIEVSE
jgi:hypothetical protein